jgi:hypothetical protein
MPLGAVRQGGYGFLLKTVKAFAWLSALYIQAGWRASFASMHAAPISVSSITLVVTYMFATTVGWVLIASIY